ncbi:hypothetical protein BC835DRAFT_1325057 [Cytidiella melzeri]|nr:hypothetical protein BC835DRAFT_1325057 [Cytidiella melzeri]
MKRTHTATDIDSHEANTCDCQVCSRARNNAQTRSKKYWSDEGTVVIQIQQTLYRLYRGQLCQQSDYFRKMFADATSTDGQKLTAQGGIVSYKVSVDVASADFDQLWECIQNGLLYAFALPTFSTLASVLRAATALDFPVPREFARRALGVMWSADLAKVTGEALPDAAIAAQLAAVYNLPTMRKRALYELLRQENYSQADTLLDTQATAALSDKEPTMTDALPRNDILLLALARQHVQDEWFSILREPRGLTGTCTVEVCKTRDRSQAHRVWEKKVLRTALLKFGLTDPLVALQIVGKLDWNQCGYCVHCIASIQRWSAEEQIRVWKLLDQWLRISSVDGPIPVSDTAPCTILGTRNTLPASVPHTPRPPAGLKPTISTLPATQ